MILIIDNYDSFTYNLYQYFAQLSEVLVYRNDQINIEKIKDLAPSHLIISPGPGRPEDAGISRTVVDYFKDKIPILGVCLGHQCIASVFGADVVKAENLLHGKTSQIYFEESKDPLLKGIKSPFLATRYHSLIVCRNSCPDELSILAETEQEEIMALKHRNFPVYGVQFHPESILTKAGMKIISNFVSI